MNKYMNGKIYKIVSDMTREVYIGSTVSSLECRFRQHHSNYVRYMKGFKNYTSSFKILKYPDAKIELISLVYCIDNETLRREEGLNILATPNCVNMRMAGRTSQQWYMDNRHSRIEYQKKYNNKHKERIKIKNNKRNICYCSGKYTTANKYTHRKSIKHRRYDRRSLLPFIKRYALIV